MNKIKKITAREIKDSREKPTIEVEIETDKGVFTASVPSGASTGKNEALELRDADNIGVSSAIKNIKEIIAPKLKGKDAVNQTEIDKLMIDLDGTKNKSVLGANAILAVSIAVCRAGAAFKKVPLYQHIMSLRGGNSRRSNLKIIEIASHSLAMTTKFEIPLPMFNILEGGAHAKNNLAIQEFLIVPQKKTFTENLVLCNKVFQNLKALLTKSYGSDILLGDEGGFAPPISKTEQALYLLKTAIGAEDVKIALDCAASQYFQDGKYRIDGNELTRTELLDFYKNLVNDFDIISIEDPFSEEDWQGFELIVRQLGGKTLIIGDDLTTTNIKRIKEAHNKSACNGVILKLNQIGTVSETIEACNLVKSFKWKTIVSHRSGETIDDFIADLSVGMGVDYIKSGSPTKEERMVKYNKLLVIENEIN
jgi:enolase